MAANAIDPRISELIARLNQGSIRRLIRWEETADENMFRVGVGRGMVRVGEEMNPVDGVKIYSLWVLDGEGRVIEDLSVRPDDAEYAEIQELFRNARRSARSGQDFLEELLNSTNYLRP